MSDPDRALLPVSPGAGRRPAVEAWTPEAPAAADVPVPWRPIEAPTLPDLVARRAAAAPASVYLTLFGQALTAAGLYQASLRYAGALRGRGLGPGDAVAIVLPTCHEFFSAFFGALALGAVPVPCYPTLAPDATARVLRDAEARAVITTDWFRDTVEAAGTAAPGAPACLTPDLLEDGPPLGRPYRAREEDPCFLQYTSGSTAAPRGVVLSHANVMATVRLMVAAIRMTPGDTVVSWLPLYHDMGLIGCGFVPLYTGAPLVLLPPDLRNPRAWLEAITACRGVFTVSPDFGYRNCVRHVSDPAGLDLGSLRMALSGAEPVRLSTIRAFEARFGVRDVFCPAYGLAEATLAVAIWPPGEPVRADPSGRFVWVGRPCPGVRVAIETADGGRAGPGEVGEILVRSPGVMQGYHRDPEATRAVLREGWLHTGDLGFLDAEGRLYVTGRLKDLIVVRGENVVPGDIEEIADGVAGIRYSAAVGLDSARTGTQRLHLVAEVRGERQPTAELAALARRLVAEVHRRRGLRPARVLLVAPHTIPKTSSGKIQRAALAARLADGALAGHILYATGAQGCEHDRPPRPAPGSEAPPGAIPGPGASRPLPRGRSGRP